MKYTVHFKMLSGITGEVRLLCSAHFLSPTHLLSSPSFLFRVSHLFWSLLLSSSEVWSLFFHELLFCKLKLFIFTPGKVQIHFRIQHTTLYIYSIIYTTYILEFTHHWFYLFIFLLLFPYFGQFLSYPPASTLTCHMTATQPERMKCNTWFHVKTMSF